MAGARELCRKLRNQVVLQTRGRLGIGIGRQLWADVINDREGSSIRREGHLIGDQRSWPPQVRIIVSFVFAFVRKM